MSKKNATRKAPPEVRQARAERAAEQASAPEFDVDPRKAAAAIDGKAAEAKAEAKPRHERYPELAADLLAQVAKVDGVKVAPNKSNTYTRVLSDDGKVLGYVWVSTRQGVLVDVYTSRAVKGAKAARGRARKEGKVVTVAKPGEIAKAVEGVKVAQAEALAGAAS